MARKIYLGIIGAVILFGLLFLMASFDRKKPLGPMEAPVKAAQGGTSVAP